MLENNFEMCAYLIEFLFIVVYFTEKYIYIDYWHIFKINIF